MDLPGIADIFVRFCTALLGVFGNSLVITSVKKFEWMRTPTNYLVALLAFFDFCNGLPVFAASSIYRYYEAKNANVTLAHSVSCKVLGSLSAFSGFGNLLTVILITLERYFYIVRPLRYHDTVTNKRVVIISIFCLLFAAVVSVMAVYGSSVVKPCYSLKTANVYIMMYLVIPLFVLTLFMAIFLYGKIALLAYKARNSKVGPVTTNNDSGSQKKTTKVISLVVGIFMMTYGTLFAAYIATRGMTDQLSLWIRLVAIWTWRVSESNTS